MDDDRLDVTVKRIQRDVDALSSAINDKTVKLEYVPTLFKLMIGNALSQGDCAPTKDLIELLKAVDND